MILSIVMFLSLSPSFYLSEISKNILFLKCVVDLTFSNESSINSEIPYSFS